MRAATPVRILAAAGVLALALVGLVARETLAREQGTEVRLALAGYDPRSLLQGHYVQFNLAHPLPDGAPCPVSAGRNRFPPERDGWVALVREGDHHRPVGHAATRGGAERLGEVAVRGGLSCLQVDAPGRSAAVLSLGVDRIHLEQEEAEAIEAELLRARPEGGPPGYAVLSVGRDGKARVKGLIVGSKRTDLTWF